jgi:hypothetical protein
MVPKDLEAWDWDENVVPDLKEWDGRYECMTLHVTDNRFYWKAVIRHTDVYMETDPISMEEIKDL